MQFDMNIKYIEITEKETFSTFEMEFDMNIKYIEMNGLKDFQI